MFDIGDNILLKEFWEEISHEPQLVYSVVSKVTEGLISVTSGEEEAGLFWSDSLRAELWFDSVNDPDCVIVSAPLEIWRDEIIQKMGYDNVLIGLNWGEEEFVLTTGTINFWLLENNLR